MSLMALILNQIIEMKNDSAICVVMASNGYPEQYKNNTIIRNLDVAEKVEGSIIFHAGTDYDIDGNIIATGGRVLGVTAIAGNIQEAHKTV